MQAVEGENFRLNENINNFIVDSADVDKKINKKTKEPKRKFYLYDIERRNLKKNIHYLFCQIFQNILKMRKIFTITIFFHLKMDIGVTFYLPFHILKYDISVGHIEI